jgi:hypothetical protein
VLINTTARRAPNSAIQDMKEELDESTAERQEDL